MSVTVTMIAKRLGEDGSTWWEPGQSYEASEYFARLLVAMQGPISGAVVAGDQTVSDEHLITSFGPITMTGQRESSCLSWQVRRLGSSDADSGTARLYEFDIHFISDKRGTQYEIPEAA